MKKYSKIYLLICGIALIILGFLNLIAKDYLESISNFLLGLFSLIISGDREHPTKDS